MATSEPLSERTGEPFGHAPRSSGRPREHARAAGAPSGQPAEHPWHKGLPAGVLLAELGSDALRRFREALGRVDLGSRHLLALHYLACRGSITQQELADAVTMDPTKLVGILNDLEASELAFRRRDPCDRRRHIVEMSEQGRNRLAAAVDAVESVNERILAPLSDTERHQLWALLLRIAEPAGPAAEPDS